MREFLIAIVFKLLKWINQSTVDTVVGFTSVVKLSLVITPFVYIWDKITNWGIENENYILIVLGAIMIDWLFGTIKHLFFTYTFSLKRNAIGLTIKIGLAVAGGFLFEGLSHLISESDSDILVSGSKTVTRVIILMYPGISAFENIYVVSGEKFPPRIWMERLKAYKTTLNPKDLYDQNKDDNYNK